jgi:hypothetical protein
VVELWTTTVAARGTFDAMPWDMKHGLSSWVAVLLIAQGCMDTDDAASEALAPSADADADADADVDADADADADADTDDASDADPAGTGADGGGLAGAVDPAAVALPEAPSLRWVMYGLPGTARLMRPDANGNMVLVRDVPAGAVQWRAVAVAGDRLLWQSNVNHALSLFRLDNAGNILSFKLLQGLPTGFRARGLSADQDVICPPVADNQLTYSVLIERPPSLQNGFQYEAPRVMHYDNAGNHLSTETLPNNFPFATVREFRPVGGDIFALVYRDTGNLENGGITYYRREAGSYVRLFTNTFTSAGGLTGCISHDGTACTNLGGAAPGAGFRPASIAVARRVGYLPDQPAMTYTLWSRSGDGVTSAYQTPDGQAMIAPELELDGGGTFTGESFAAAKLPVNCVVPNPPFDP